MSKFCNSSGEGKTAAKFVFVSVGRFDKVFTIHYNRKQCNVRKAGKKYGEENDFKCCD